MTTEEAKAILLLRRGPADDVDPQIKEALLLAGRDPELRRWLEQQEAFHTAVRSSLQSLPVPKELSRRILAHAATVPVELTWWQRFPAWAAAAAVFLVLGLWWWSSGGGAAPDTYDIYRSRMVRSILRQYQMDIVTNDMVAIRQFLTTNQAPADYVLPNGLQRLSPSGAGLQRWQGERVSMVCMNSGKQGTAVLFVVDAKSVKNPPPTKPVFEQVSKLTTASWTTGGRSYLLMLDNAKADRSTLEPLL